MSKKLICRIALIVPGSVEKYIAKSLPIFAQLILQIVFKELRKYCASPWFITAHNGHIGLTVDLKIYTNNASYQQCTYSQFQ